MGGSLDFRHKWECLIGLDKLECNNVTNKNNLHYKNKLQHRNSTLSDNPHAYISIKGDNVASKTYFVAKDEYLLTNICNT